MKDQAFSITKTTKAEFLEWCKENKKPAYKAETKQDFFDKVKTGRLVRDAATGKLVVKRIKK
jgi:hypothetical protein